MRMRTSALKCARCSTRASQFTGGGFRFPYKGIEDIRALMPDLSDEELARIEVGSYTEADMRSDLFRHLQKLPCFHDIKE